MLINHIKNSPRWALLVFALVLCAVAAPAPAQSGSGSAAIPPAAMLLQQMHMANQVQIKAAETAKQKATHVLTRRLADRLWRDHQVADGKVRMLAEGLDYQLKSPEQMQQMMQNMQPAQSGAMGDPQNLQQMQKKMQMMQQMLSNLQSTPGPQFDEAYVKAMTESQQNMLQMLQQAQTQAKPPVNKLLDVLIPILGQHVALAQLVMTSDAQHGA